MKVYIKRNEKSEFTRRCIAEAIIQLLKQKDFNSLKISEIVRKAGVSRTIFYQYYSSPYDVLTDYLRIIVSEYIISTGEDQGTVRYFDYSHILHSLKFFDRYADFFLTLSKNKLHSIMIDGINGFMTKHIKTSRKLSVYTLYSYAGGLLNIFLQWEESGKRDSAEDIAKSVYEMYGINSAALE